METGLSAFAGAKVLITGASAGLGEEFAKQLATAGVSEIIITARRADRLEALKTSLAAGFPNIKVVWITSDLSKPEDVAKLMADLDQREFWPEILINNAGFGDLGVFEESDPAKIEGMLMVNVVALTRLTRWILPRMVKAKKGWICNVGSTAGVVKMLPTFAAYAATKAYVNSFSEAVRVECLGTGVCVSVLAPGPVPTEFGQVAERPGGKRKFEAPSILMVEKDQVVREALEGLAANSGRVLPGFLIKVVALLFLDQIPAWMYRIVFGLNSGEIAKEREEKLKSSGATT